LSYQAYLGMANTIGIDRVLFTTDHPYGRCIVDILIVCIDITDVSFP
jgi:hypothetical protein